MVWNSFETLCYLRDFEFYAFELSWELFHPTSDVMSDLSKLYFKFVTYKKDLVIYSCCKKCFMKYQSDTFYELLLFITSIWTDSMYLFFQEDVDIFFIPIDTFSLGKKCFGRGL